VRNAYTLLHIELVCTIDMELEAIPRRSGIDIKWVIGDLAYILQQVWGLHPEAPL
jgi:hypothetical protein